MQVSSWRAALARAAEGWQGAPLHCPDVGSLCSQTQKLAPGQFSEVCVCVYVVCGVYMCVWYVCAYVVLYPRAGKSWTTGEGTLEVILGTHDLSSLPFSVYLFHVPGSVC